MKAIHFFTLVLFVTVPAGFRIFAADFSDAEQLYRSGDYDAAAAIAGEQVERGVWNAKWPTLLIRCQLKRGQYAAARGTYEATVGRYRTHLPLRRLGIDAYRFTGDDESARAAENAFVGTLQRSALRYLSRDNRVAAGRFFVEAGEDARVVLTNFFDPVLQADPEHRGAAIATAELALAKGDDDVAVKTIDAALIHHPEDADLHYLAARGWAASDPRKSNALLAKVLRLNANHVEAWLMKSESADTAEDYEKAVGHLNEVLKINPHHPVAWGKLAAIANLRGEFELERLYREAGLAIWPSNPEVDHAIGKVLARHYRFAEAAAAQRRALEFDADHPGARFSLAQDLLRLGETERGWELAEAAADADPYNVVAYNLATLKDEVADYVTLREGNLIVRMERGEAAVYGSEAIELLRQARDEFSGRYDVPLDQSIVVEIFARQSDFAIRTFGLPGGAGYLGVCFGNVITANSPASGGADPANWKSVLWHEFVHVVTLTKTRNRMPRWLSEGISVYEERRRRPNWGEQMTIAYRRMITNGDLTPVSRLSSAFSRPKSPRHLLFAYYEASLVVEYIIDRHGFDALLAVLDDLAEGLPIGAALERRIAPLSRLDAEFADYARGVASSFAPLADWSVDPPNQLTLSERSPRSDAPLRTTYNHVDDRLKGARRAFESGDLARAETDLARLLDLGVVTGESGGTLDLLTQLHRSRGDTESEMKVLKRWIADHGAPLPAIARGIELARMADDAAWLSELAGAFVAKQPLVTVGHRAAADAAKLSGAPERAVAGLTAITRLNPVDPAGADFELATALRSAGEIDTAKRRVLMALDHAPRFRAAHALLLELTNPSTSDETETQP